MEIYFLYFKCVAALIVGLFAHTYTKHDEASELFSKGNVGELTFTDFLKKKPMAHVFNLIMTLFWLLVLPDVIRQYPEIKGSVFLANIVHIIGCAIWGYGNSSLMLRLLGTGTKYAMDVIDKKTNIADGK